jgi:hypothetical protein
MLVTAAKHIKKAESKKKNHTALVNIFGVFSQVSLLYHFCLKIMEENPLFSFSSSVYWT